MKSFRQSAFTLAELLVAATIGVAITLGMVSLSWSASRLGAKNLAYNHGALSFTQASNRLVKDAQSSASIFTLVDFNGTTYTDSAAAVTGDQNPLTLQYMSARSNAVRFWKQIGGPFQLNVDSLPATTNLSFNFGPAVNGALPYTPTINDKLWFPLLDEAPCGENHFHKGSNSSTGPQFAILKAKSSALQCIFQSTYQARLGPCSYCLL